jgi:CHAD domain-containing protein
MAHKRVLRKKQDTSLNPLAHLRSVAEAFNLAAAQSVADADADAVHRVRTGSRRLQAMIEATLREAGSAAAELEQPAQACLRPLKQIRRASGAVRDLDVQRKLLEDWIAKQPADASLLRTQAETLQAWLINERKRLAHGMQKQIRKRQQGLTEQQDGLLAAIACAPLGPATAARPAEAVALEDFVRAADAMPLLHAENLHDFRKATKKARYVAESGGVGSGDHSVAKALKQIQDAIGDWHDWLCLARDAKGATDQDAAELTTALGGEVELHFAAAMKTTQSLRAMLLGEWMATLHKQPPAAVGIGAQRRSA